MSRALGLPVFLARRVSSGAPVSRLGRLFRRPLAGTIRRTWAVTSGWCGKRGDEEVIISPDRGDFVGD